MAFGTAFACSFALLGLAQKLITAPSRWVKLASESAYTVYILHYLLIARLLERARARAADSRAGSRAVV